MTSSAEPSDLISQPRVMFGRMLGSALIRSRVCIMASTLWIPYCSRTAPHFRSWTLTKHTGQNGLHSVHRTREKKDSSMLTTTTLSAGGWWWTENRAPMMMSPGMCANTLLSLFWPLTPAWCLRPSRPRSATRKMASASKLTQSPGVNPILRSLLLLLTPPQRLCPLKVEGQVTDLCLTWCFY